MSSLTRDDNQTELALSKPSMASGSSSLPSLPSSLPSSRYTYALLQETSGEELESWYVFIRYQGNEEALKFLNKQLEEVEWYIVDDLSTFDLEIDYLVSEQTAKEMTKVDINHTSFHRKFDGKLKKIDLGFKDHHSNLRKMTKAFDKLGYGGIENFIDNEDIDPEDIASHTDTDTDSGTESEEEESGSESEQESPRKSPKVTLKKGKFPKPTDSKKVDIPRFAKAKAKRPRKTKPE